MTRYLLQVYRGSSYYPDKNLQSRSRGRIERRAQQLEHEGFQVRLIVASGQPREPAAGEQDIAA
jgi:hypothetical protein